MTRKSSVSPLLRASAVARIMAATLIAAGLSACMEGTPFPTGRSPFNPATAEIVPGKPGTTEQSSAIIAELAGRVAVIPGAGPYAQIRQAVLADAKGSAKAELRVARLTAEARSKNWLPQIGPTISLTRLGDLAAELLVQQALWDNGAKRAERDHAAADVEVAAVSLATEMNDTVAEALKAYVTALKAEAQGAVADQSAAKIASFDAIMRQRVEGGLSDASEARVLSQKLSEIEAQAQTDRDTRRSALAQLQSMTATQIDTLGGLGEVSVPGVLPDALSVTKAKAEAGRAEAEAKMGRAGHLPKLGAEVSTGTEGTDYGLSVGIDQMLGFGTKAQLEALDAATEAAFARVDKARQADVQDVATLLSRLAALQAKEARDAVVVRQTGDGLEMFTEQYRMGRRSLMELVNMYESYAEMAHAQAGLKYDIALIKLEIARKHGILVDGSVI